MPSVRMGAKDGPAIELRESRDLLVVRTRSGRSLERTGVARPESEQVRDGQLVAEFPEAGVEVYRMAGLKKREIADRKAALRRSSDVRFAGSVLVDEADRPVLYTENLFIKFRDGVEPDVCLAAIRGAGCVVKERVQYAPNAYFIAAPEGTGQEVFAIADRLLDDDLVEFCHPELIRRAGRRAIDPRQWHLASTTIGGARIAQSVNADAAHAITRGDGVVIAVIDDGVDVDHEEFASPGKVVAPRDATLRIDDARPKRAGDTHGTPCAGVACADGSAQASGVAPGAKLMPIRLSSANCSDVNPFPLSLRMLSSALSCSSSRFGLKCRRFGRLDLLVFAFLDRLPHLDLP
ncbi:MAG: S8 family serine peptidase, partial [Planctomycetota bacterium]